MAQYKEDLRLYNKHMKKLHLHDKQMNLEDYVKYRHGMLKIKTRSMPLKTVP